MSDDEIKAIEKFKTLNIKHFNLETIYENDLLSYYDGILILNLIEKQQDELSKKDKVIDLMAEDMATDYHSKEWVIEHYLSEVKNGSRGSD